MKNADYIKKKCGDKMVEKQKILIVDDKPENLVALEKVLESTRAQIIRAGSGNDALKATLHHSFALAILDVQMPGMDGYELAEFLRGENDTRNLPIIFTSAVYSDDYYIFKGYDAGAVDYIVKPFNPTILLSKVKIFLQLDRQKIKLMRMIEIEKSKNHLENILMTTPDLVFVVSPKGIIENVNWTVSSVTRFSREKLMGLQIKELFSDNRMAAWLETLADDRKTPEESSDTLLNLETELLTSDQSRVNVLVSCSRLKDRNKKIQGAVIVAVDITNRIQTEKELEQRTQDLSKRVKELDCLFKISKLLEKPEKEIEKTFQSIINLIPQTWHHPEIACAILTMEGKQIKTDNYTESPWQQSSEIFVHGETVGYLKIGYLGEVADKNKTEFIEEEKKLLNIIAQRIGSIIERIQAEKKAEHLNVVLRALRNVNKLITRENNETWLINSVCDTLVNTRGYSSAWIILKDKVNRIRSTAGAGLAKNLNIEQMITFNGMMRCCEKALSSSRVIAVESINSHCRQCPLEQSCAGSGAMAVRLEYGSTVYGVLAVTIPEYLATDEEEHALFKEISNDLAFALYNIESRAAVKKAQKALSLSRGRYAELIGTIEDWIWEIDPKGVYSYVSPRVEDLLGYTAEEVLGKTPDEFLAAAGPADPSPSFIKTMDSRKKFSGVISRFRRKEGGIVTLESSGAPFFDENGHFLGYFGIARDITERKRLEYQLQQSQKMEALGTLAGGIAHDFNNILFPITAYTEMTMDEVDKDNPVQDYLQGVLQAAQRAKELIRQILSISRSSDDDELSPLIIQPIIKEALKLIRASIPTTIEIVQDITTARMKVMADSTQIHQVIMNLCTNAFHAMQEKGGILKVCLDEHISEKARSELRLTKDAYLCLSVSDTGHGMPKSIKDKIFDPYFTTKGKNKGTGLGLSIVRGIIRNYGGDIAVDSEIGKGSTFRAYFPVASPLDAAAPEISTTKEIKGGQERILLVDDEESIIQVEKKLLSDAGYRISEHTGSQSALTQFKQTPDQFDLVITDMTMPKLTGIQLSKKILKIRPDIPIILCTGFSNDLTPETVKEIGLSTYLKKPIKKDTLLMTIRNVLDQKRAPSL
jgi:PAS domain S-box-containing protein